MFAELSAAAVLAMSTAAEATVTRSDQTCAAEALSYVAVEGARIAYRDLGPADGRPVLLIGGTDQQLTQWPRELLNALQMQGHRPILYDARDVGCSTHHDEAGAVDWGQVFTALAAGQPPVLPYDLARLASDAAELLEQIGLEQVDVVGVSGGATVAGELAAAHPERVGRLALVMANSGNPALPMPADPARLATLPPPPPPTADVEEVVAYRVAAGKALEGPTPALPEAERVQDARIAAERSWDPDAIGRAGAALLAAGDRRIRLSEIHAPAVVIHGEADPLVSVSAGREVAEAIPGARFVSIPNMGHALTAEASEEIVAALAPAGAAHDQH